MKLSAMEQNQATTPSPPPPKTESTLGTNAEDRVPQVWHQPQVLPLRPAAPETDSTLVPTTKPKASMTRATWVNAFWADISGQLRRRAVISSDLFDGLSLRRDTPTGSLIFGDLRHQYEQLGDDRTLATVTVLPPERPMRATWQLLWTIKRVRDPNGRQFHCETTVDPINNESHLELEDHPGQLLSITEFSLPPFIQDYGPGPAEFDPEPEDEFDAVVEGIIRDVYAGTWIEE